MNKIKKIILAFMGAIDVVMTILIPLVLVLMLISLSGYQGWTTYVLIIAGIVSSIYRGISIGFLNG